MYVKRLYKEDYCIDDSSSPEVKVPDPNWEQIEYGIRQLDGNNKSVVIIGQQNPEIDFMGIGGGKNGIYRCFVFDADACEFALIDPSMPQDQTSEVLMGQPTSISLQECVDLDMILKAARFYAEHGELEPGLNWKKC